MLEILIYIIIQKLPYICLNSGGELEIFSIDIILFRTIDGNVPYIDLILYLSTGFSVYSSARLRILIDYLFNFGGFDFKLHLAVQM